MRVAQQHLDHYLKLQATDRQNTYITTSRRGIAPVKTDDTPDVLLSTRTLTRTHTRHYSPAAATAA